MRKFLDVNKTHKIAAYDLEHARKICRRLVELGAGNENPHRYAEKWYHQRGSIFMTLHGTLSGMACADVRLNDNGKFLSSWGGHKLITLEDLEEFSARNIVLPDGSYKPIRYTDKSREEVFNKVLKS